MNAICLSQKALYLGARDMLLAVVVFAGLCGVAHCGSGCMPANSPDSYETAIIACAATAGYPGAYDHEADMRCRDEVNERFGVK